MDLENFVWAKSEPRKSLYCHMYEAAITMKVLMTDSIFSSICSDISVWLNISLDETIKLLMYLSAIHDIGKIHPLFQSHKSVPFAVQYFLEHPEYIDDYGDYSNYRHEKGSNAAVKRIWRKIGIFDEKIIDQFSCILQLHHQGKNGRDYPIDPDEDWDHPEWQELQDLFEEKIRSWIDPPCLKYEQVQHMDAACTLITSLIILTDWIVSSTVLCDFSDPAPEEQVKNRINTFLEATSMSTCKAIEGKHIYDIWPWMNKNSLRPLQKTLDECLSKKNEQPLFMVLEAPMGEGKTEAGIYAAIRMAEYWKKHGLYIGLPTAATSNQMCGRVNDLLESHDIEKAKLLHSMAWLNENEDEATRDVENEYSLWNKPSKRALLSPWAVGTIDQALLSVLQVKYGVLRLLGLSEKVLVLDEIHAYDAYMSSIIKRLLEWCKVLRIPVVLMSATLPNEKREEFMSIYTDEKTTEKGYPLITSVYENGLLEQYSVAGSYKNQVVKINTIENGDDDVSKIICKAEKIISDGGCLCIIVNTVKKSQLIYRKLMNSDKDYQIILFHSRYTAARKKEIEEECIKLFGPCHDNRPKKAVLVATQVVEQSLDLDFDAMISEIAPIDLLLQRCGRLHRHNDTNRPDKLNSPEFFVIVPPNGEYGSTEIIYYPVLLDRTAEIFSEYKSISIPEDIPVLVNRVYGTSDIKEDEFERFFEKQFQDQIKEGEAEIIELEKPSKKEFKMIQNPIFMDDENNDKLSAKTRFSEDTAQIAVLPENLYNEVKCCVEKNLRISSPLAKQVMQYGVSVRKQVLDLFEKECNNEKTGLLGKDKLIGVTMYCAEETDVKANENATAHFQNGYILVDKNEGLILHKDGDESGI